MTIEEAILSTLVVENKQSIHHAVEKIKQVVLSNPNELGLVKQEEAIENWMFVADKIELMKRYKVQKHHADQLAEALREALPCLEYLFADKAALVKAALANYEQGKGYDGWISVEERLPTKEDGYPGYDEVLVIQHGRNRPTMMKYWEVKKCPFTHHWMKVPAPPTNHNESKT